MAITMGDASGVGPELVLRNVADGTLGDDVVVYGDAAIREYVETIALVRDPQQTFDRYAIDHVVYPPDSRLGAWLDLDFSGPCCGGRRQCRRKRLERAGSPCRSAFRAPGWEGCPAPAR